MIKLYKKRLLSLIQETLWMIDNVTLIVYSAGFDWFDIKYILQPFYEKMNEYKKLSL